MPPAEKGVKTQPMTERNNRLFRLKEKHTFKEISEKLGISEKRAKDIYYKELKKRNLKPRKYKRVCSPTKEL